MKKILFAILVLFPLVALAQGGPVQISGDNVTLFAPTKGALTLRTEGTQDINFQIANTAKWKIDKTTGDIKPQGTPPAVYLPPVIITPVTAHPTPGGGGDVYVGTLNRLVAGSPTLAYVQLPVATANIGRSLLISNEGSYPVLIAAQGSSTVNAATANTPFSCASAKLCDCIAPATGLWKCGSK